MAAPMIPEAPVTSAVFGPVFRYSIRSLSRSSGRGSAIRVDLVQRLEDQNISGPTRVVARDVPIQRIGDGALHQRTQRTRRVEVDLQSVELAESERLLRVARPRITVHSIDLHQVHHVETVVHIGLSNRVKRIRTGRDAMQARGRKERREETGKAIQLISSPVREVPSALGELSDVIILVQIGVVEGKSVLRTLHQ